MKYEVGDRVRKISDGKEYVVVRAEVGEERIWVCHHDGVGPCSATWESEELFGYELITDYLTTEELVKKARSQGYKVNNNECYVDIFDIEMLIASVSKERRFGVKTLCGKYIDKKLYNLLDRYARTPLDKRVTEKRFYLKKKRDATYKYFVLNASEKDYGWCSNPEILAEGARTIVFKDEIPELQKKFKELNFDELERVEAE